VRDVAIVVLVAAVLLLGISWLFRGPDEADGDIPTPPAGYEYCADEYTIGFCKKGS